jgi:hypothetical protein
MRRSHLRISLTLAALVLFVFSAQAAQTLPASLSDAEYWKLVSDLSEPSGYFQYEIVTSNETSYQMVLPDLVKTARGGGVYLGVGPEQNFTYIAALNPKISFLIDIRRDMMLEHLLYKVVFEMSPDRVRFVSNLFARTVPPQLAADSSVQAIFQAFARTTADSNLANERINDILQRLKSGHHFPLSAADEEGIKAIYRTFAREGVLNFSASFMSPGYATLMTLTDGARKNWSFLATNENYERVRAMQQKNLIVPLVGDFAGPKTLRNLGQYLKDHGSVVGVFYISNVEDYIQSTWQQYLRNLGSLPTDDSSLFIRWSPGSQTSLAPISDLTKNR